MQMNQVHRFFNKHIWSASTGNPQKFHRHQVHQAEVYLCVTLGRVCLINQSNGIMD